MGKKTRKTRWRALEIGGESDSEESNTLSTQTSKSYGQRPYYSKYTFSSQSTPTRRYPHDAKSTRSSSTASETKITFNEDEYTKITTPRQDVLFKKGYLNKPKTYQTQTSTGNSTASTGNSTGNGTPDHQSADGAEGTDLEYESQFVFPNGFVDHHGVYYINSFEPYPLVMYNPPICYSEYPISRSKRHSTGSLTESTSPHNEEASQEFSHSGGETSGTVPECNQVYNVVYPGYYLDGVCGPNMVANGQASTEPRKVRKKRRRRVSKNVPQDGSTSSDDYESSDDAVSQIENRMQPVLEDQDKPHENLRISIEETDEAHQHDAPNHEETKEERLQDLQNDHHQSSTTDDITTVPINCDAEIAEETKEDERTTKESCEVIPEESKKEVETCESKEEVIEAVVDNQPLVAEDTLKHSFNLNAEEFYPRAYRNHEQHQMNPNFHFVDMHHPNFIPLPFVNELGPAGFNPQFLPAGIPLGFMPHDPKLMPNFVNFVPNQFYPKPFEAQQKPAAAGDVETKPDDEVSQTNPEEVSVEVKEEVIEEVKITPVAVANKTDVDIAKIVSKLEEAAKEQILQENQSKRSNYGRSPHKFNKLPRHRLNGTYNHSDGGYRSSYDRRGRHFERNRRPERLAEQNTKPAAEVKAAPEPEAKAEDEALNTQQPEIKTEPKERQQPEEIQSKDNSRHNSPRHVNYKNQYQSPRRFNYYNKNTTPRPIPEVSQPQIVNYSETLKRQPTQRKASPRYEKATEKKDVVASPLLKKDEDSSTLIKDMPKPSKTSSQWISVSNRKKRKNKTSNEEEFDVLHEDINTSITPADGEVLILTKEEEIMINEDNQKRQEPPEVAEQEKSVVLEPKPVLNSIDTFIEMVASKEASPIRILPDVSEIIIQDIQDVEKELLKEIFHEENLIAEIETPKQDIMTKTTKGSSKKKSKKGVHKLCPKRIIIKDLDFSKDYIEVKPTEIPESPVLSEVKPVVTIEKEDEEEATESNISQNLVISTPEEPPTTNSEKLTDAESIDLTASIAVCTSTPDKKKPKKKKKTTKPIITANQSASSSSTTLNVIDESYDFLLDTSVLVDDKTNVEVSEELDRMIQRGLYGNLEEKMKSLNVSINEDFFKSLSLDTKQSTPEKGFIKATDFSSILKNANQILTKNKPESHTNNKIDIDFTKIKLPEGEPQPSTSKDCAFLELPQVKTDDEIVNTKTKSNGKLKNKSKKHVKGEEKKLPKNDEAPLVGLNNGIEVSGEDKSDANGDAQSKNEDVEQNVEECEVLKNDLVEDEGEISSSVVENEPDDDIEDNLMVLDDKGVTSVTTVDDSIAQTENQKHIVQSTANAPDQIIEENNEVIKGHLTNGYTNDHILQKEETFDGDDITINGYTKVEIHAIKETEDLIDSYLPNGNCHNEEDNNSAIITNIFEQNGTTNNSKHHNGYKDNFLPEEMNGNHIEDKICCKTYETFQVEDIQEKEELNTNGFVQITLSSCEDHQVDRKDSTGNVSDAFEATDENITDDTITDDNITSDLSIRPQKSITQAVFEWMTKTRENTPEVEILKSPDTINRELVNHVETDSDEEELLATKRRSKYESDEEITIFEHFSPEDQRIAEKTDDKVNCNGVHKVEQAEDVLEVYESKYGKNEDFLKLKAEIEEHKKKGKYSKHGDLPYRAICCSLM